MKQLIIILLFLLPGTLLFAQSNKRYVHTGNELYQQQKYKDAEASYRKSVEKGTPSAEGSFNLGDALYKQKKFDNAGEQFSKLASSANNNKLLAAQAYHNLGNTLMQNKKLEESIAAYKKSLLNNPKDDETRYNLAYAQEKLKQQQQQDKKKDKQNKDKKDQNKQNQDKKDQDKKDKDKDKKDKDQPNKDQKPGEGDKKDGQQPQPDKLSKEDAQRMLDALNNNEKETQEKLKNKKLKGVKVHITKDW